MGLGGTLPSAVVVDLELLPSVPTVIRCQTSLYTWSLPRAAVTWLMAGTWLIAFAAFAAAAGELLADGMCRLCRLCRRCWLIAFAASAAELGRW